MNAVNRYFKNIAIMMLALLIVCTVPLTALAQTQQRIGEIFKLANRAYEQGDYQKAAGLYRQVLGEGYESGNLYYNLGNCYYKLKQKGRAILYYEKARRLIPGDADLQTNLAYVGRGTGATKSFSNPLAYLAPLDRLLTLCSAGFFLLIILIITAMLATGWLKDAKGKFKLWWRVLTSAVGGVLLIGVVLTAFTWFDHAQPLSVVTGGAVARYEPNSTSTVYYSLPEGSRVRILTTQPGWSMVQRADGKSGWVQNDEVERI
jgi:tetratricopeptide (TPR) repeat protein